MTGFDERMESARSAAAALGIDEAACEAPAMQITRGIAVITEEIIFYKAVGGAAVLEIGKRLIEAKAQLGHGEWLPWLQEKVDFSERSAQAFMRLAREYTNPQTIADLGTAKALELLALPASERAAFTEEKHDVDGVEKSVAEMTAKELKEAIRAREAAEEKAADAEAVKERLEQRMKIQLDDLQAAEERANEAEETVRRLEEELQELRDKPVEVAVQERDASPEQLKAARDEAEKAAEARFATKMQDKEQELASARADLKKAREEVKEANVREREARSAAETARAEAEKNAKLAKAGGNQNFVKFSVLFQQTQDTVNRMAELLAAETEENSGKMKNAMCALADAIRKAADR